MARGISCRSRAGRSSDTQSARRPHPAPRAFRDAAPESSKELIMNREPESTRAESLRREVEIEKKFWKALASDRTAMLGLSGVEEGHTQPMTAQFLHEEDERGPIWFFTAKDTDLVRALGAGHRAGLQFVSKSHELFASLQGDLVPDNDRAMIDRLWNRFVAAWYEGGKDDPKLQLLRFDPYQGQFWLNENSLLAGVRMLLGRDPKQDYADKTADVRLHN
jgi:general stress protein 26